MRQERNLVFLAQNKSPLFGCYMRHSWIVALECVIHGFFKKATFLPPKVVQTQRNAFEQSGLGAGENLLGESNLTVRPFGRRASLFVFILYEPMSLASWHHAMCRLLGVFGIAIILAVEVLRRTGG